MRSFTRQIQLAAMSVAALTMIACGASQLASPTAPSTGPSGATIIGTVNGDGPVSSALFSTAIANDATLSAMGTIPQGLTVTIEGTSLTVSVDASGHFQFVNVPAGDIRLVFRHGNVIATVTISNIVEQEQIQIRVTVSDRTATVVSEERSTGRVELCHRSSQGQYHSIVVSDSAEPAHRAHGDGAPGERVPGAPTRVFDRECRSVNFGVAIRKLTNGHDADTAPGPTVPVGSPVVWEYIVSNTGTQPLTNVRVVDDKNVVVNCNGRTTLALGESMTCRASGVAVVGQYRNVGTVTANAETTTYTDSNPSHYFGQIPTPGSGERVQLCHRTGNGSYHLIEVSVSAEPAHRGHGDAKVGEPVPANPSLVFGANCAVR